MNMNEAMWKALFIRNIKSIIAERHMSQTEVSMMTGLSKAAISRLLSGHENPTIRTVLKFAYGFRIKPSNLIVFPEMFK